MLKKAFLLILAVCSFPIPIFSEVAGTPAAPAPGPIPYFWARFGNDFFGFLDKNPDDFRSTQTIFGARVGDRLLLTLDFSAFTDRGPSKNKPDPSQEGRIDQATISLARRWSASIGDRQIREYALGLAVRRTGDLNGAAIQNGLHEVINDKPVYLPYEDESRLDVGPLGSFNMFSYLGTRKKWGLWFPVQGMITTAGQAELSAGSYATFHPGVVTLWTGLRGEARSSGDTGEVIDNAFDQEEGAYYILGFKVGPVVLDLGHKIGTDYGYGWMTFMQDHRPAESVDEDRGHDLTLSLGAELPYFGLRTDLGWLAPTRWSVKKWRWGVAGVFTGGELPDDAPTGWDEYQRGLTAGPSVFYFPGWAQFPGASFTANVRYGERREGFLRTNATSGDNYVVTQNVVAGDFALVIALSGVPQEGLGLKLGVTGWKPLDGDKQVMLDAQPVTVMGSHVVPYVTFDYGF